MQRRPDVVHAASPAGHLERQPVDEQGLCLLVLQLALGPGELVVVRGERAHLGGAVPLVGLDGVVACALPGDDLPEAGQRRDEGRVDHAAAEEDHEHGEQGTDQDDPDDRPQGRRG